MSVNYKPVIIIGAPRSGTNMLRNVLSSLPGVATWPCDEINYIWRHGNHRFPSDEFTPDMATEPVCRYIRGKFEKIAKRYNAETVIEKTCANTLRVGFVSRVLPDANYVYIRRRALDVIASMMLRWQAEMDMAYILKKARYVPLQDLPYYAASYIYNRCYRLLSPEKRLAAWGPRLHDMQNLLENYSLLEVCGFQWQRCVLAAEGGLKDIPNSSVVQIEYERFVSSPEVEAGRLADFLGIATDNRSVAIACKNVVANSIGKGEGIIGADGVDRLKNLLGNSVGDGP